jgi:hypothetical protein
MPDFQNLAYLLIIQMITVSGTSCEELISARVRPWQPGAMVIYFKKSLTMISL